MNAKEGFAPYSLLVYFFTIEMRRFAKSNGLPFAAALALLALAGCDRDKIQTYKVDSTNAVAVAPPSGGMPGTMPDSLPAPDNSGLPKLKYTLPEGWQGKPLTQWRVASFTVSENGKSADISVVPLGGMAGGDLANVNRWRRDVGQSQLATDEEMKKLAEPVTIAGQPADLYDLSGTSPGSGDEERIVAAILHNEDTAWFFKMTGAADLVKKNKPAFVAFLQSVAFAKSSAPSLPPPAEASQLPAGHPAIPGAPIAAAAPSGNPTWTVPSDWKSGEPSQFVLAKFDIQNASGTAAATVSQLDGDGGGLLANVNRWRGQLGQQAIFADDAAKLPAIDAGGIRATVADFNGTDARTGKPARLVGVVLPRNGQTWFYKLMGDPDVVAAQKDAFIKFVQSAKYPQ